MRLLPIKDNPNFTLSEVYPTVAESWVDGDKFNANAVNIIHKSGKGWTVQSFRDDDNPAKNVDPTRSIRFYKTGLVYKNPLGFGETRFIDNENRCLLMTDPRVPSVIRVYDDGLVIASQRDLKEIHKERFSYDELISCSNNKISPTAQHILKAREVQQK